MSPRNENTQIPVKLNEHYLERLDKLAKNASVKRHHLMLCLLTLWLKVLEDSKLDNFFNLALVLREHEKVIKGLGETPHEYIDANFSEKAIPINLSDDDIWRIKSLISRTRMNRHQLMKNMIIVGIEELEHATDFKAFQYAAVEPQLYKTFATIMHKADKALRTILK